MGRHNKSLELTPGVPAGSVDASPNNAGGCAVIGGAAQLYVMHIPFGAISYRERAAH